MTAVSSPRAATYTRTARAVPYTRVSVTNGRSIESQLAECRRVIEREGWQEMPAFSDDGISGFSGAERPDWERLLKALEADQFDILVVYEPSRATRDRSVWAALAWSCESHGVKICANGRLYDLADPDDAFALDLFFALARRESAVTKKRVLRGTNAGAAAGRPGGSKAPFGYRRERDQDGKVARQVPDEKLRTAVVGTTVTSWSPAGVVREIFANSMAGMTAWEQVARLNARGIPNPRTLHALEHHPDRERARRFDEAQHKWRGYAASWTVSILRSLVRNRAYIGQRVHRGKVAAENCWPTLVEQEVFYTLANEADGRKRVKPVDGQSQVPITRPASSRHLLSRITFCDACGVSLVSTTSVVNGETVVLYRCPAGEAYIARDDLDHYVIGWVLTWLSAPANLELIRQAEDAAVEIARARTEAARLRADLESWSADAVAGTVSRDDYKARRAVLLPLIEVQDRLARASGLPPALQSLVDKQPALAWAGLGLAARRDIVRTLVGVRLHPVGRGRRGVDVAKRVTLTPRFAA